MQRIRKALGVALVAGALAPVVSAVPAVAQDRYHNGYRGTHPYNDRYDRGRYRDQGGIGPGKGALIGAGVGALLGTALSGSLQGAIVGGAVGAGGGAVIGKAAQDNRDYRDYNNGYYHGYRR